MGQMTKFHFKKLRGTQRVKNLIFFFNNQINKSFKNIIFSKIRFFKISRATPVTSANLLRNLYVYKSQYFQEEFHNFSVFVINTGIDIL